MKNLLKPSILSYPISRPGLIDDETLKERLFRIAERYERNRNRDASEKQKDLF